MLFPDGFTFANFVTDVFSVFIFILWFWLLITVAGDLFRRKDVSGWGKVLWVILLIVLPYNRAALYRHIRLPPHARSWDGGAE
jgi:uncharacterized membrane protein YwzB